MTETLRSSLLCHHLLFPWCWLSRSGSAHLAGKIAGSKLVAPSVENGQGGSVNYSLRYSLLTRQPFTVVLMVCHNQLWKKSSHHLWSDVAVAARSHLSVHGDPKGKHAVILLSGQCGEGYITRKYWLPWRVIWNDHAIGDDGSRGRWWRREQAQGVAWVEHQGLVLAEDEKLVYNNNTGLKLSPHGGQVVKNQSELSPVGENLV